MSAEHDITLADNVVLADHERRIGQLERLDNYALRGVCTLAILKFLGIDNLWQVISFFQNMRTP